MSAPPPPPAGVAEGPFTLFTRHVVAPAAIIAMVTAFLFYLLEIRSLYLEGTRAFRQVGFCFAAATVLIARYGRMRSPGGASEGTAYAGRKVPAVALGELNEDQGCYTLALGIATFFFLLQRSSAAALVPNLLILGLVWRFATGVTRALSLEGDLEPPSSRGRLYGLERLRMERFQERMREERGPAWGTRRGLRAASGDGHGNPVASVGRLAALALLGFAAGEPFLLRAAPEVAERALADVIVFLFATALVLAAGSAAGTLRHTARSGGRVAPGVLPARLGVAALLSAAVLAAALALPGVRFQGQGAPREAGGAGRTGAGDSASPGRDPEAPRSPAGEGEGGGRGEGQGEGQGRSPSRGEARPPEGRSGPAGAAGALVAQLGSLGKLLRLPFLLGLLVAALFALRALRPFLPDGGALLARLRAWLGRFGRRREEGAPPPPAVDPFANWGALSALPPRDAILSAYHRLLAAFEQAGHPRPERTTPYEHLRGLPARFKPVAASAEALTDLYVLAAYGDGEPDEEDRSRALAALAALRSLPAAGAVVPRA